MSGDAGYTDQEAPILEKMIMDSRCEKTKSESWARDEITRLREENARMRRMVKTVYAEGCYDSTKTEKTQEEFEALWKESFAYNVILEGGKDEN